MTVSKYSLVFGLILTLLLLGCKEDALRLPKISGGFNSKASDIEQAYFDDYESPAHKWGFIDEQGKVVIKPIFDMVKDMKSDIISANYKGKWGYIDNEGNKQIAYEYKQAYDFMGNRAFVQNFDNQWLLIDLAGKVLDTLAQQEVINHNDEVAIVKQGELYGTINLADGSELKAVRYDHIIPLEDGYILSEGGYYGLEVNGKMLLDFEYDKIYPPVAGLYKVKKDRKYQFFHPAKGIYSDRFEKAEPFHYDYTVVKKNGQYALIDQQMKEIRVLNYDKVIYAGDNKWKFKQDGRWGVLDAQGSELCAAKYSLMNRYSDGRIVAASGDDWGYLDEGGVPVIPFKYPLVWDFHDGKARVISRHGVGFLDKAGKMVIKDRFFEVRDFYRGKARFQTF